MSSPLLRICILPKLTHYESIRALQKKLQSKLIAGQGQDTLILTEHFPVITIGRSGHKKNILASIETLRKLNIELSESERGGDVTYHGPGQLVAYPILDLRNKKRDVDWYLRSLEEVILRVLQNYDVQGMRIKGKTGVWTHTHDHATSFSKIASIGVRLSRWCTLHGFSINVSDSDARFSLQDGFSLINPCGFTDIQVSSITKGLQNKELRTQDVFPTVVKHFGDIFGYGSIVYGEDGCKKENCWEKEIYEQEKNSHKAQNIR